MPALLALIVKKDNHALSAQQHVGLGLAPLSQVFNILLTSTPSQSELLTLGSDAIKNLTNFFLPYVIIRATPVLPYLNKSAKETLHKVRLIPPFFGEVLAERLKTAKALQKSGYDLKAPPPGPPTGTSRKKDAGAN
ncbi:hypothetical protein Zmor_006125 [Zophobas morio]|uniref:Uncharacterized protein n=1 Tax=Zophobas morio TaxID=2755281 RepID=A0AA38IPJ7_9CUCU|nr:hypothetical protein Zmor_006125 [Zophobas morio]